MITPDENNDTFQLAADFINETSQHIFLTGKAGTGKTTFLKYIRNNTHKRVLVAAPTGVAAINAGGITLHSLFQLPFEPFIPGVSENLSRKNRFRFTKSKLDLLRQLELLIIDEVSMLRADILDAIDASLRNIRRNSKPFGGVQVLYIGDMFQLPPIAKDDEWDLLKPYYASTFFFHAKVIDNTKPVYLELKKVYRQGDQAFIDLLNRVRNNMLNASDIEELNKRFDPLFSPPEDEKYITLTTHNFKADQINNKELNIIPGKTHYFNGGITGEFPEYALPTDMQLCLKEGAQVMFIKNDPSESHRYYNGKIATISRIKNDQLFVYMIGEKMEILLQKETWKNLRYTLNKDSGEVVEEELGTFTQYPIRLSWAITIHKSQGLTFDKAIIDIGSSFAAGQAYVALSRCTSLDGIVLLSKIQPNCILTDQFALDFSRTEKRSGELESIFAMAKRTFWAERLVLYFDWKPMFHILRQLEKLLEDKTGEEFVLLQGLLPDFKSQAKLQEETSLKFREQLKRLIVEEQQHGDYTILKERCQKAVAYFYENVINYILKPLQFYIINFKPVKKAKTFYKNIIDIEDDIILFLENIKRVRYNNIPLAENSILEIPRRKDIFTESDSQPTAKSKASKIIKEKPSKPEKGATQKMSLDLYRSGLSIEEISGQRTLAFSTIESHLAFYIKTGELSINEFLQKDEQSEIFAVLEAFKDYENPPFKIIVDKTGGKYSYGQLRMAFNHLQKLKSTE